LAAAADRDAAAVPPDAQQGGSALTTKLPWLRRADLQSAAGTERRSARRAAQQLSVPPFSTVGCSPHAGGDFKIIPLLTV